MNAQRDKLYYAAKKADDAWFVALTNKFGKRAAQVRYTYLGREGEFADLYAAYQSACKALWECVQ